MHVRRPCLVLMLTISLALALIVSLHAAQVPLSWDAPRTNTDGTLLTDLARYRIHYGTQSRGTVNDPTVFRYQYTTTLAASQTTFTITDLIAGVRYFCAVTALDLAGNESKYSTELMVIPGGSSSSTLLRATFDNGVDSFVYVDDAFRGTRQPNYASGDRSGGTLRVSLGGINNTSITNMSGGWRRPFTVSGSTTANVSLSFRYNLTQSANYESDEYSEVLATIGTTQLGASGRDYVARITGNGNGGSVLTTGWQTFTTTLQLAPGSYALTLGAYNNKKTYTDETTTLLIDDVLVTISTVSVQTTQMSLQVADLQQPFQPLTIAVPVVKKGRLPADVSQSSRAMVAEVQALRNSRRAPSADPRMQTLPDGREPQHIWLEAEIGHLTVPLEVGIDSTGTARYIWVPEGVEDTPEASPGAGIVRYAVTVAESGLYVMWGRIQRSASGTGSFFLTVNHGPTLVWDLAAEAPVNETGLEDVTAEDPVDEAAGEDISPVSWQWQQALQDTTPVIFLEAGVNILALQSRECGAKLDRLLFTNDLDFVPQD